MSKVVTFYFLCTSHLGSSGSFSVSDLSPLHTYTVIINAVDAYGENLTLIKEVDPGI